MGGICPTGRLLARGVVASTRQLVLALQDGQEPAAVYGLMAERQRLLAELARKVNAPEHVQSLAVLTAAVAESDRTMGALLA